MLSKEAQIFVDSVMEDLIEFCSEDVTGVFRANLETRISSFEKEVFEYAKSEIISAVKRVEL